MRSAKARSYRNRRSASNSRRNRSRNITRKPRTRTNRKRSNRMHGGTVLPSEYFGKDSGRYSPEEFSNPGEFAYGKYTPQSYGENFDGKSHGPNLGVYPDSSNQQTGGYKKRRINRKSKKSRRTRRNRRTRGNKARRL